MRGPRTGRVAQALVVVMGLVLLPIASEAQVRPDSTARPAARRDSVAPPQPIAAPAKDDSTSVARITADRARRDSLAEAIKADTIKAPLANFERPSDFETTGRLRFSREQILQTGAVNLADILDQVPGITTYRSGWVAGLHAATYAGDGGRLRLFVDGVELDPISARSQGTEDLTDIPLWTLDELIIERAAGEVRVWMRTWTVTKTVPYTRVDILTGDLNTNAFRGQFARRWRNGFLIQFGGQQVATQTGRVNAFGGAGTSTGRSDGTVQGFLLRTGWSRGRWSVDGFANAVSRDRDAHRARTGFTNLPSFKGQRREGYLRAGYGDTTKGFWSQLLVQALRTRLDAVDSITTDTLGVPDTLASRTQQIAAVGYRAAHWNLSLTNRMRLVDGGRQHAPALRGSYTWRTLDAGLWMEQNGRDSTNRADLFLRARPFSWLRLIGGYSSRSPDDSTRRPESSTVRAEAAVRFKGLWFGGGVLRDAATVYDNLRLLGMPSAQIETGPAHGLLGSVSGRLYKDLRLDLQVLRWDAAQYSRPTMQIHSELILQSDWKSQFPKGEFSINTRLIYDRRGGVPFFYGTSAQGVVDTRTTEAAQVVTGLLEIRIQQATLFYQYRNLTGGQYEQIRGITMPPAVQMYGVRWIFFN